MNLSTWYAAHFESRLRGRYLSLKHIDPLLKSFSNRLKISYPGNSEQGKKIPLITLGHGSKIVLAWSQMHGNESTTTKALFDLFRFLDQKNDFQEEIEHFLQEYTLYAFPILNPDGAERYTRENANGVDLNRDAVTLSQSESRLLKHVFDEVQPNLCLNLHDQRTIYGLPTGLPATISFLAPAADPQRALTPAREVAMQKIIVLNAFLQNYVSNQIGRYDDTFNANCVGDAFQQAGVPTILFEAGHFQNDYEREITRKYIFLAFSKLFGLQGASEVVSSTDQYFSIPENRIIYKDVIIRNVCFNNNNKPRDIGIQFSEILTNEQIDFVPHIDELGDLSNYKGHREIDGQGCTVLVNSHQNTNVGQKVSIISNKTGDSVLFIPEI
ncbi:M14 family zinc carboxypeptidase [Altibacter sp.]|uniref:M14 family zinc carboxypeptidase n=1 Tax=Altibacter sp. TaxID=2024823 RepID=UPI002584DC58|nr:M14 family zinc carboxypeptidase [Altibacter sp.]MCW9037085.1 M14 family zinc carboxypeptidase [Altibacter sp.]